MDVALFRVQVPVILSSPDFVRITLTPLAENEVPAIATPEKCARVQSH